MERKTKNKGKHAGQRPKNLVQIIGAILLGGALIAGGRACLFSSGKKDYDIRLTHDKKLETAACFVDDNKIVYAVHNSNYLYMIELQDNKTPKPKKIFDGTYKISSILGMDSCTGICSVDSNIIFPALIDWGSKCGVFSYNIKTKELKQIFSSDESDIIIGISKDEKRIVVESPQKSTSEPRYERVYYSIPIDTNITYTSENPPQGASQEDIGYVKDKYERMFGSLTKRKGYLDFPYGERNGMIVRRMELRTGLVERIRDRSGDTIPDLVLVKEEKKK